MEIPENKVKIVAATITHGHRWQFLKQVVEAVMKEPAIMRLVIVDNGSKDSDLIKSGVEVYGEKVRILKQQKNSGSAGGFATAIESGREENADYLLLLDDDSVPESNFVQGFLSAVAIVRDHRAVIAGARTNVGTTKTFFYPKSVYPPSWYRKTFFEIFSLRKLLRRSREIIFGAVGEAFVPVIPVKAFVYGGTLIPMEAVRKAPLPDRELFLYGDDIDYAWGIEALGYPIYMSATPAFHDVDMTFPGSHITGLFDYNVPLWKVYYRLRNMVRLSIKHQSQSRPVLFINVLTWFLALILIGLWYTRGRKGYWKRVKTIIEAARAGYDTQRTVPEEAKI